MAVVISLQDVVAAMDMPSDEITSYLDPETGEIASISEDECSLLESGDSEHDLQDGERELLHNLREILESDRWLPLPDRFEIHEWSIMERFSRSLENDHHREELLDAIHGSGAFRLFHRTIDRLGIREDWYQYRGAAFEQIAREWLESHGLRYK
jgi:hypothetical protein